MAEHLKVDPAQALKTSQVVSGDAEVLRGELARICQQWDNVSGWSGAAASASAFVWEEWHDGAAKLVELLAESTRRLGHAAVAYENQEDSSAKTLRKCPLRSASDALPRRLEALLAFADTVQTFERRAEIIAARVDERVAGLHPSWSGQGASAHLTQHQEWMAAARQDARSVGALAGDCPQRSSQLQRRRRTQHGHADVTQDVDTLVFYSVGGRLFELAGEVYDAFAVNVRILGETGAMAGTDDAGIAWATSYDGRALEVLGAVNDLTVDTPNTGNIEKAGGRNGRQRGSQVRGGGVVLDLRNSPLTPEQIGDLLPRVRGITDRVTDIIVIG